MGEQVPVLELSQLRVVRGSFAASVPALTLAPGAAAALVGPSGSGKTTLLHAAFCLHDAAAVQRTGDTRVLGQRVTDAATARRLLREQVLLLPQDAKAALDPLLRIEAQLMALTAAPVAAVRHALATLGIEACARRYPHAISGGEAQRALLALVQLRRPRLLVLDEPTASLDRARATEITGALRACMQEHWLAILVATHDRDLVTALCAQPFVGEDGCFVPATLATGSHAGPVVPGAGNVVLRCEHLACSLGGQVVLRDASLELRTAEITALLGPSGAGKTTLARILAGLQVPDAGVVLRPPGPRAVQLLFQEAYQSLTPGRTIRGLVRETAVAGFDAAATAAELGLVPDRLARARDGLSGGERRRAALLRALSVRPTVLILDEPTSGLDPASVRDLVGLLGALRTRGDVAVLLITHDEALAHALATRVVRLHEGRTCS